MKPRVVVGLSGGVDSAVSAWLLKRQGFEVVGLFMKNWEDDDDSEHCSSNIDFVDAAAVADVIGIELEHVNFAAEYKDRVFAEFLREYEAGRTPNPDVLCNAEIKFKAFLDHALRLGAGKIATGHYARVRETAAGCQLLKGLDPAKDQSYFLHRLTQAQLSRTLFPVGELEKTAVRRIAQEIGLPNAQKKDSTGICFIGERPFREFLQRYLKHTPGPMLDEHGRELGRHLGLSFYTLGQRQGLGIGGVNWAPRSSPARPVPRGELPALGRPGGGQSAPRSSQARPVPRGELPALGRPGGGQSAPRSSQARPVPRGELPASGRPGGGQAAADGLHAPWFVAHKDMAHNVLRVVQGHGHPALLSDALRAQDCSWVAGSAPPAAALAAKARYRQTDAACHFTPEGSGFALHFAAPQWAVTPGQSAVLYDGEVCLGGGVIASAEPHSGWAGFTNAAPAAAPTRDRRRDPARRPAPSR